MVIDTSAIVSMVKGEDDAGYFARAIYSVGVRRISAASWLEASIILDRHLDGLLGHQLDRLITMTKIQVEDVTVEQAQLARQAYMIYGKGHHAAALNFGDCFAYALAKSLNEPLLFKGNDFVKTDVLIWRANE